MSVQLEEILIKATPMTDEMNSLENTTEMTKNNVKKTICNYVDNKNEYIVNEILSNSENTIPRKQMSQYSNCNNNYNKKLKYIESNNNENISNISTCDNKLQCTTKSKTVSNEIGMNEFQNSISNFYKHGSNNFSTSNNISLVESLSFQNGFHKPKLTFGTTQLHSFKDQQRSEDVVYHGNIRSRFIDTKLQKQKNQSCLPTQKKQYVNDNELCKKIDSKIKLGNYKSKIAVCKTNQRFKIVPHKISSLSNKVKIN